MLKSGTIRVLLVDDHPIVRQGIRRLLEQEPDIEVCGEADDVETALEMVAASPPDLAIIDICLPGEDGLDLVKHLCTDHPCVRALVLSMHDEGHFAIRALRSGAHGYIMKQEAAENVVSAVRTVLAGDVYVSEALRRTLDERAAGTAPGAAEGAISRLSDRELQVFQLIGNGWNMRRIADELHVSINTVETHRAHIRRKLNIRTTPDLLRRAVRWVESVRPR